MNSKQEEDRKDQSQVRCVSICRENQDIPRTYIVGTSTHRRVEVLCKDPKDRRPLFFTRGWTLGTPLPRLSTTLFDYSTENLLTLLVVESISNVVVAIDHLRIAKRHRRINKNKDSIQESITLFLFLFLLYFCFITESICKQRLVITSYIRVLSNRFRCELNSRK